MSKKKDNYIKIGYKWKSKHSTKWGDAADVGAAIEKIEDKTPRNIVKAAKKDHVLKVIFYSEDESALADRWRIQEARQLCANLITIYQEKTTKEEHFIKTYESIPISTMIPEEGLSSEDEENDEKGTVRMYVNVVDSLSDNTKRGQLFDEVTKLMKQAIEKQENFKRVSEMFY